MSNLMGSPTRCLTPTQPLPRDLSAPVAEAVIASLHEDDGCTRRYYNLTVKNCILVSQSFAYEFRPYLYEALYVIDHQSEEAQEIAGDRLCDYARTMQERPEYQKLVKKVFFHLDPRAAKRKELARSLVNFHEFPSWLEGLQSVVSVTFGSLDSTRDLCFSEIVGPSMRAISRLCSLPSINSLSFSGYEGFLPHLVLDAPNLLFLNIVGCHLYSLSWVMADTFSSRSRSKFPRVTNICIHFYGGWRDSQQRDWQRLDKALSHISSLETLELSMYHHGAESAIAREEVLSSTLPLLPSLPAGVLNVQVKPYLLFGPRTIDWP
ncbi:hypothetical protein BKA70DRAFT_735334 [Coprinopsis sp. MPI-PUGE-AT-0042]|nr:hypothetical protein BKA70DRAFT_735334 [Coprinopsis sp. MPI-PUGE-AT-0042]